MWVWMCGPHHQLSYAGILAMLTAGFALEFLAGRKW